MDQSAAPWPFIRLQAEQPLHHRGQVHPVEAGQPARQLGVVERGRPHADLGEARQVLVGGVQHPLVGASTSATGAIVVSGSPPWLTGSISTVPAPARRICTR